MALSKVDLANQVENQLPQNLVANNLPFRNIIINGDMSIAQRGTSTASITSAGYYTVDRHRAVVDSLGTWTMSQSTDVPSGQGFAKSLKYNCTTADASPSAGDVFFSAQYIEGQMLQYLKKGTSNAESLTLSFWVKSNKTGTYIAELFDNDNARTINKSYTINSASTWEKKTITFAGDTTGTLGNDNGLSFALHLWLGAGSNFTSGTLATSWESQTNANRAVGQVNLADNTANEWYITGIQLEAGTTASDFEFLPVDVNLQRCQRYFEKTFNQGVTPAASVTAADRRTGICFTGSQVGIYSEYSVTKRANPTITIYRGNNAGSSSSGTINLYNLSAWVESSAIGAFTALQNSFSADPGGFSITTGNVYLVDYNYTADAEL
jgi:hypothetical protein